MVYHMINHRHLNATIPSRGQVLNLATLLWDVSQTLSLEDDATITMQCVSFFLTELLRP